MNNQLIVDDQRNEKIILIYRKMNCCFFLFSGLNSNDHSRRLIQTAYVCFQQLNECEDLNDEQKQWIQTWMDAVSNV